ncbi:hypothetical protein DFH09DRAFT_1251810 [Mycena vulgaris]|nr:hypothetical protein DFH09DRAFT_1251810 [Mycena vulgaris]
MIGTAHLSKRQWNHSSTPELPLGAIKPSENSWLQNQLIAQANGLHGNLQKFWPSVQTSAWLGGADYNNLHEGGDIANWVSYIVAHQGADGWLGPDSNPRVLWGTYPALLALRQYAQANSTAAPTIYNVMDKSGAGLEEWGIHRWQDVSIVIQWMLEVHPNGRETMYLNLLESLRYFGTNWTYYFSAGVFPTDAVNHVDINFHGVNIAQAIKSEAVAFRYTHNQTDVDSTRNRISILEEYHGRVSGVFGADEHMAGKLPSRGSELCMVVEMMYSFEYVYSVLGDNAYADKIERLAFNALPGTLSANMWEHQYLQQTNQIQAAYMDPSPFATDGPDSNTFGLAPNFPCCTVNHGQGWPKFISHSYMTSSDAKTLYHVLLSPTTFSSTLFNNNAVTVNAQTNYPFSSTITYHISAQQAFSLGIRVPSWVHSSQISYTVDAPAIGLLNIASGSHIVTAVIPMSITTEQTVNNAVAVSRGPLVYSLNIDFNTTVLASYALSANDLKFLPTSAWQYAISTANLDNPMVTISADVCPITWAIDLNSAAAPPSSPAQCAGAQVRVNLVPYGNAKLRMTELPTF